MRRPNLTAVALALASITAFVVISGLATSQASAASVRKVGAGSDSGDCVTSACKTIGYALSQAGAGDTILVGPGLYKESLTIDKSVVLVGNGATIDGSGHNNTILIQGPASAGTVIQGFTIQNALLEGILAMQTSNLAIRENTVINNDALWDPINVPEPCQKSDDCGEAIHLMSVSNSIVESNTVQNNVGGILLTDEMGPTAWNVIRSNIVADNEEDCGITIASHFLSPQSVVTPDVAGIYNNLIINNTVSNSGAAGVGIFAGPPGAAAYQNVVIGNTLTGNGFPGVALHAHAPNQNLNYNAIVNNVISGNGFDPDVGALDTTGISVGSAVVPVTHVSISNNTISDSNYGIFLANVLDTSDITTNTFTSVVENLTNLAAIPSEEPAEEADGGEISPPNTGDGGLADDSASSTALLLATALIVTTLAGAGAFARVRR